MSIFGQTAEQKRNLRNMELYARYDGKPAEIRERIELIDKEFKELKEIYYKVRHSIVPRQTVVCDIQELLSDKIFLSKMLLADTVLNAIETAETKLSRKQN